MTKMINPVTPLIIRVMLACHVSSEPDRQFAVEQWGSTACEGARAWLMDNGLIDGELQATERGRAWVHFICAVPLPVAQWVLPDFPQIARKKEAAE